MSSLFPVTYSADDSDFDNIISTLFNYQGRPQRYTSIATTPRANVLKHNDGYAIELAAPGLSRDEFEIGIDDNVLSIHVGASDTPERTSHVTTQEFSFTSFTRTWNLPKEVNVEAISAQYDAGILYVQIPTSENSSNKITVTVE